MPTATVAVDKVAPSITVTVPLLWQSGSVPHWFTTYTLLVILLPTVPLGLRSIGNVAIIFCAEADNETSPMKATITSGLRCIFGIRSPMSGLVFASRDYLSISISLRQTQVTTDLRLILGGYLKPVLRSFDSIERHLACAAVRRDHCRLASRATQVTAHVDHTDPAKMRVMRRQDVPVEIGCRSGAHHPPASAHGRDRQ